MWDLLWHRGAVLSGLGTFWKRSVSRSCLGVFLCCFVLCCCCLLFVCWCWLRTLSPILQQVGIAYQRQNVLMTVWASSAHGMSKKKIWMRCFTVVLHCLIRIMLLGFFPDGRRVRCLLTLCWVGCSMRNGHSMSYSRAAIFLSWLTGLDDGQEWKLVSLILY